MIKMSIAALASVVALTGCTVYGPQPYQTNCTNVPSYQPELPNYATAGALIGAATLGILSEGQASSMVIGAGVGGLAGAAAAGGADMYYVCDNSDTSDTTDDTEYLGPIPSPIPTIEK